MRLFLDCEFNGFGGQLLSMALVPEDDNVEPFYKELIYSGQLHPWVRENVAPHMHLVPVSRMEFQNKLANFLWDVGDCTIIADWPDDIRYFCESLITGPGECITLLHSIKFELDLHINYESLVPHNALADAKAIKVYYLERERRLK